MFKKKSSQAGDASKKSSTNSKKTGEKKSLFSSSSTTRASRPKKAAYKRKGGRFVALDLGNYAIKFAVGNHQSGKIKVDKMFSARIPEHLYMDSSISDEKKLLDLIKSELSMRNIKDVDMIVSFESTSIIKRRLTVPVLSEEETKELIGFELEEYLGINPDDYIIQYKVLSEYENDGRKRDIQIDAVPRAVAKKIFSMLKQGGFNPCILGIQSSFVENMNKTVGINNYRPEPGKAIAVADIGNSGIVVNIFKDGKSEFNRIIRSTSSIRYALMTDLGVDESVALSIIQNYRSRGVMIDMPTDTSEARVFDTIRHCVDEWIGEIDRVLEYYRSRSVDNKIEKLYLYGGDSVLGDLDKYFEMKVGVPTEVIRNISNLEPGREVDLSDVPMYVNPICALMRV